MQARTRLEELDLKDQALKAAEGRVFELERDLGGKEEEAQGLRAMIQQLQEEGAQQEATYKSVVRKLMQNKSFGEWILTLTAGAESWGKNLVLQQLMEACPQLLLKKSELGWDPKSKDRVDFLQQRAQKEMPDFTLLNELEKEKRAWSAEEVERLSTDYDDFLDEVIAPPPDTWVCAHDGMPIIADASSTDNVQPPPSELDVGDGTLADAAGVGTGSAPADPYEAPTPVD